MTKWILKPTKNLSVEQVGKKAANLSFLITKGYTTPRTVFIPVFVFEQVLKNNGLDDELSRIIQEMAASDFNSAALEAFREKIEQLVFPEAFLEVLTLQLEQWAKDGIKSLAVRSSAVREDLGKQSFAGQYLSILKVPLKTEEVSQAIRKVWASLFSERVFSYGGQNAQTLNRQGMGVILQEMIEARLAGVVFSQNPLMTEKEEMLIEYVEGGGQQLMDGQAVPQRIHLNRERLLGATLNFAELEKALPNLEQFTHSLLKLEKEAGHPIDVEWAFDGKAYYFLQFRPITTLTNTILWTDENVGEVIPDVVTPFSWSILEPMTNGAYRYFLHRLGLRMPKEPLFTLFEGKVYFNQNAFRRVLNAFYLSHYLNGSKKISVGTLPKLFKPIYYYTRLGFFLLRLPYKIWPWNRILPREVIIHKREQSPEQRIKEIKRLLRWADKIMNYHVSVTIFAELYYQALDKICKSWCQGQNIEASHLLQGIGDVESTQPARALWEIGQLIRKNESYREIFEKRTVDELQEWLKKLPKRDPLHKAIDMFLEYYGHGALHEFELIYPRWNEDAGYILQSLRNYARYRHNETDLQAKLRKLEKERKALKEQALNLLKKQSVWRAKLFAYLLKKAEYFSLERELLKQQIVRLFFGIKQHLVAISRRFFDDDLLIFYLTWPEVQRLVKGQLKDKEITLKIQQRRLLRNKQMEMIHPKRLLQSGNRWIPLADSEPGQDELTGIPCSPGLVEGKVRIILQIDQSAQMEKGDILVTKATNPGWTPIMVIAGGIITEIGGALSHGAIIAREFGIPMVAAVSGITERLKSGQWVRLNGQTGKIEILEED